MDQLYLNLNECAALHPDPQDSVDEDENEWITSAEDADLSERGEATLQHLNTLLENKQEEKETVDR